MTSMTKTIFGYDFAINTCYYYSRRHGRQQMSLWATQLMKKVKPDGAGDSNNKKKQLAPLPTCFDRKKIFKKFEIC